MMKKDPSALVLDAIAQTIYDKKGFNILALDVREISSLTDFFIIAEGTVDRHVRSISLAVEECMQKLGHEAVHVEGGSNGDWIVMDFSDVIVHLFIPELREKYGLEKLWSEGKVVDVEIQVLKEAHE